MDSQNRDAKEWYYRTEDGHRYGPATKASLAEWAKEGRILPSGFVSKNQNEWIPAQLMPELELKWVIETEPGKFSGPYHRDFLSRLSSSGAIPAGVKIYRSHDLPVNEDPPPVEKIVEKVVEKIVEVEPPPRATIVEPEVVSPVAPMPPQPALGGIFKGADRDRLAALEAAARRELVAAKQGGFSMGGLFRRKS